MAASTRLARRPKARPAARKAAVKTVVTCQHWERSYGDCTAPAKWKVPLFGETEPYCLCDEHVKGWNEWQPENVKALDDNTPWSNKKSGFYLDSTVKRRQS